MGDGHDTHSGQKADIGSVLIRGSDYTVFARVSNLLSPFPVEVVPDNKALLDCIKEKSYELIISSDGKSAREELVLLGRIQALAPQTKVVLVAAESSKADAISAMKQNAFSLFSRTYFQAVYDQILIDAMNAGRQWEQGIVVHSALEDWLDVSVRCQNVSADRLVQFFNEICDFSGKALEEFAFVFRELLMNAMEYGGSFDPNKIVHVSYIKTPREAQIRICDPGQGFSLGDLEHASVANPPEDPLRHITVRESQGMRPGGFGIMLARKLVDVLMHSEKGNKVLMIKYLG